MERLISRLNDRAEAGRLLADALASYRGRTDLLILALPRGGVPVAIEVAISLQAPIDVLLVRKLGLPGHEELAMGAIASGGELVLNDELIQMRDISPQTIAQVCAREQRELQRRERVYRGDRPAPPYRDRCVIAVDDGIATGATMRAGVRALRRAAPARIVVAVPVMPPDAEAVLREEVDELVCLATPEPFYGVGCWYRNFAQVGDDEVRRILQQAWHGPISHVSE